MSSGPNTITVSGNLTADPELRRTAADIPFARLRMAVNRRIFVAERQDWEDRHDGYFNVVAWRDLARHVVASLRKGDRVVVSGRLSRRPYEAVGSDGAVETRHSVEIEADDIGGSLRWYGWQRQTARPLKAVEQDEASEGSNDDSDEVGPDDAVAPAA